MIEKEFRALLPLWTACGLAMLLSSSGPRELAWLTPLEFLLGAAAIGAWSIGHEFSFRTVDSMLALPIPRARIWGSKLAVTGSMLAVLGVLAYSLLWRTTTDVPLGLALYYLPPITALCLGPWLTMATRSVMAGTLFPLSIAGVLMVASEWMGVRQYGFVREVDLFRARFMIASLGALSAVGASAGWIMFMRLEARAARQLDVERPSSAAAPARVTEARPGNPLWMLVKKELRLQQLTVAVALVFVAIYVGVVATRGRGRELEDFAQLLSLIYVAVQSLLAGSLASAEERQLGTHDAQLLLPIGALRQWTVKAGTTVALAMLLAVAFPLVLTLTLPIGSLQAFGSRGLVQPKVFALVASLTTLALYISTLCGNGLRALMITVPVLLSILMLTERYSWKVTWATYKWLWVRDSRVIGHGSMRPDTLLWSGMMVMACIALWRAFAHFQYAQRSPLRIAGDAGLLAGGLVAFWVLSGALLY